MLTLFYFFELFDLKQLLFAYDEFFPSINEELDPLLEKLDVDAEPIAESDVDGPECEVLFTILDFGGTGGASISAISSKFTKNYKRIVKKSDTNTKLFKSY